MPTTEHRLVSFDKTPLFYRRVSPASTPRAELLILHGMMEHGGRYLPLAEYLSSLGIASCLPDTRGFGQSGGPRGCVRHFSDYYRDLHAVHAASRLPEKDTPFFVLGHSYGGLITSSWVSVSPELQCRGLVLTSPNFGIAVPISRALHVLALAVSYILPDLTQPTRVNILKLTHDKTLMAGYSKDPYLHDRISTRLYRELVTQMSYRAEIASKLRCPVLVLQAGDDHVVSREKTERFFEELSMLDKTLQILEGQYHEVLNEVERGLLFARIGDWILKHL